MLVDQLIIFSIEVIIVSILLLLLFRFRPVFGLSPLYITLGVFQPIQVFLASSIYVEIIPGILVSPGSVILFTASLFVVLLIYIQEDAIEARKAIYGLMLANITMSLLLFIFGMHIDLQSTKNFLEIPKEIFTQNARIMLTGTIMLFVDVVLIIFVYELLWRWIKNSLLLRIYLSMTVVLVIDSLGFCIGAFAGKPNFVPILVAGIIGKLFMAFFYSVTMAVYLKYFEAESHATKPFVDIFYTLTYRQKYEVELFRWQQIFLTSSWGIVLIDPGDDKILITNEAFAQMHGYKPDDLVGKRFDEHIVVKRVNSKKQYNSGLEPSLQQTFKAIHIRRDGSSFPVLTTVNFVNDASGKLLYLVANVQDVTVREQAEESLKASEEKYRLLVENQTDMVVKVDLDGKLLFASPSYCKMFDREESAILGENFPPFVVGEKQIKAASNFETLFSPPFTTYFEHEALIKHGWIWVAWLCTAVLDRKGRVKEIIGVGRNVSERKKLEKEKEQLQAQLLQSQKLEAIGTLAGGVAHDFNNMLGVIIGYSGLLKSKLADKESLLEDVVEIERAAMRSKDTTSQLLAFSRQDAVNPTAVDLLSHIESLERTLSRLIGENIELKVKAEKGLQFVKIDPSQLDQIVINLIVNSRDAMPSGGKIVVKLSNITLDLDFCAREPDATPGRYVLIEIEDNGVGMDSETMMHVFEPFFTTKKVGEGTGLGLATIYGIIKQNKGIIHVTSDLGEGTVFKVYLPAVHSETVVKDESPELLADFTATTILLVEDDTMFRGMVKVMLEEVGFTVIAAVGPEIALALCKRHRSDIDLLLTDVVMPEMNGVELAARVSRIDDGISVLFMSGYSEPMISQYGVLGTDLDFIQKPFSQREIAEKITETLGCNQSVE